MIQGAVGWKDDRYWRPRPGRVMKHRAIQGGMRAFFMVEHIGSAHVRVPEIAKGRRSVQTHKRRTYAEIIGGLGQ